MHYNESFLTILLAADMSFYVAPDVSVVTAKEASLSAVEI